MKMIVRKTAVYFSIKYVLLYLVLAFKNDNYYFFNPSNMTEFWYWYLLLSMPALMLLLFFGPFIYLFKTSNRAFFILILTAYFLLEYILYTCLASTTDLTNGLYNELIGIFLFLIIFGKQTYTKFTENRQTKLTE
jgi:hypothetical protein